MFMYEGYELNDVILNHETAEEASKRNGITLILIKEERIQAFYFDAKIYVSKYSYIESKRLMDHNLINPAEDIILEQGKIQVRNLWFYKKWGLLSNEDFFKL